MDRLAEACSKIGTDKITHLEDIVLNNQWTKLIKYGEDQEVQFSIAPIARKKLIVQARYFMKALMIVKKTYCDN